MLATAKSCLLIPLMTTLLIGCQAQTPQAKPSSTQDLLAQVEAIEADEAALLFQRAKEAAKNEKTKEARSLIQQALGRGAGSLGLAEAQAEIKKAEARIGERKRKAEEARRAREAAAAANSASSSYTPSSGEQQVSSIIVTVEPNKYGRTIENFRLSRSGGSFGSLAGSSVSIQKPYSGSIGGTYSFSLSFKFKSNAFVNYKRRSCQDSFSISGYKRNVLVKVYEDCRIEIYEN